MITYFIYSFPLLVNTNLIIHTNNSRHSNLPSVQIKIHFCMVLHKILYNNDHNILVPNHDTKIHLPLVLIHFKCRKVVIIQVNKIRNNKVIKIFVILFLLFISNSN